MLCMVTHEAPLLQDVGMAEEEAEALEKRSRLALIDAIKANLVESIAMQAALDEVEAQEAAPPALGPADAAQRVQESLSRFERALARRG